MRGPCDGGDSCWCLHDLKNARICCWCGVVYVPHSLIENHGQYAPLATPKPKTKKVKR
jgi:hypothetical protein